MKKKQPMSYDEFQDLSLDYSSGPLAIYPKGGLPPIQPVDLRYPLPVSDQSALCYRQTITETRTFKLFIDVKIRTGTVRLPITDIELDQVESIVCLPRVIRRNNNRLQ